MANKKQPSQAKFTPNAALDKGKFRKRLLLEIASRPFTLWPFVLGSTILLTTWTFSLRSGVAAFAGIASILAAVGTFFTRLLLGSEKLGKTVIDDLQKEMVQQREASLDDLERRLCSDGDTRTENSLRDLRTLAKAFRERRAWSASLNASSTFDILSGVEQLFNRCVVSLERSLNLWYTAYKISTPDARQPILTQRELIIEDVAKSIKQLSKILAGIQSIRDDGSSYDSELGRIRQELDRSLQVAKMVEERMQTFSAEIEGQQIEKT